MLHIFNNITEDEVANLPDMDFIRVLGFNSKGQELLKQSKQDCKFVTQFKNTPQAYKNIEWKVNLAYSNLTSNPQGYIKRELQGPIIK